MINVIVGTSILILAILLIRKIFWKKCSPNVLYFLWIFVAFRILISVNIPLELPDNSFGIMPVPDYGVENDYDKNGFSADRSGSELNTSISGIDITENNDVINIEEMQKDDRSSISEEDNEADNSSVRAEADIYSETKTFTKIKSIEKKTELPHTEVVEQEYELLIESIEDLERGINLHYSNCYTTNLERGSNHFWIDEKGILWGEGTSEYGQLGILKEDLSVVEEPVKIAENVIHVDFSGEYFTIYLTSDYKLYGLGASPAGILTQSGKWDFSDTDMKIATEPVLLMNNVVFAQSGYTSIITLLENGDVYVLGNNEYIPYQNTRYIAPRKVMEKARYVTTYFHTYAAIDENNNLWAWGHNELGQCGMGDYTASVAAPQKIMEDVECVWMGQVGFNHTDSVKVYDNLIVLKKDGNFYGCGEGIGESRLVKGGNDLINEESEVISSNHFCKINIKEYVPPSLKDAELLWKEEELKDFLENSRVKYYVSRTEDEGYLLYVAKEEEWEFIFNKEGLLADITSYRNDELEEDRLEKMDSFAKIINCYGEYYKKIDAGYGHFVMEYEREDYDFRIFVYSDLECGRFSKVLKGFYE